MGDGIPYVPPEWQTWHSKGLEVVCKDELDCALLWDDGNHVESIGGRKATDHFKVPALRESGLILVVNWTCL